MKVRTHEMLGCPLCGNKLETIGSRSRKVIEADGDKKVLVIRRLRCQECKKIHHELPDILIPYKRHCSESIEKIIGDKAEEIYAEASTVQKIKAWWAAVRPYLVNVLKSLKAKLGMTLCVRTMAPREIVRAAANAHLFPHTRSAFSP